MQPTCPPAPDASNYEIAACMMQQPVDFSHAWSPEMRGNMPSPTPTPVNENVAHAMTDFTQAILLIGILVIILGVANLVYKYYVLRKETHVGRHRAIDTDGQTKKES